MSEIPKRTEKRIEMIVALLMAVAIVSTAWCAYQATLWSGIQVFLLRDAGAAGMQFTMKTIQQGQRTGLDSLLFIEYIKSLHNNDTDLANFYLERVRPELRDSIMAWLDKNPFENPNAPPHPFVMPEYEQTFAKEAEDLAKQSEIKVQQAQQANQNSDNYVLLTVLYASVLFSGGIITRFSSKQLRMIIFAGSLITFSVATSMLVFLPITT